MLHALTWFHVGWSIAWGAVHVRIRKGRDYSRGRAVAAPADSRYRRLNPLLFLAQLALTLACFWSDAPLLLRFHEQVPLRVVGAALLTCGLLLTLAALRHLRGNYSPCYDSHLPHSLVSSGPYARIRHPMYLAKLLAGAGTVLLSGSLWLVASTAYLFVATWRALEREERYLLTHLPGYDHYVRRTRLLVPYLF